MIVPVEEVLPADYPGDPAIRSTFYNRYQDRQMRIEKRGPTTFEFTLESDDPYLATIVFPPVDLALFVPALPEWVKGDGDLEVLTLVEREWNRQQAGFASDEIRIIGGDGYEKRNLTKAALARNCLNAGLWEILLFDDEGLFYQGWFDFPLGHYKDTFETINNTSYWKYWWRLEHWFDPSGKAVNLDKLRTAKEEQSLAFVDHNKEPIIAAGEQKRKRRTLNAPNARTWEDLYNRPIGMATFAPPGRYEVDNPWDHDLEQLKELKEIRHRKVTGPHGEELDEIELVYPDSKVIISGIDLDALPQLKSEDYPKGLYMPMGISVPPTYQEYRDLEKNPPQESPYFNVLVDNEGNWLNHHQVGIDGIAMHKDEEDEDTIHLYPLSYERHTLLGHYTTKTQLDTPRATRARRETEG